MIKANEEKNEIIQQIKDENIDEQSEMSKELITVKITSIDQLIKSSITCFNTDFLSTIEEKLYIQYPHLKNKKIYFLSGGNIINKSITLEQNKIKNNTQILINYDDYDD